MKEKVKIKIENLNKSFSTKVILKDLNLEIPEKASVAIIGGSGTGKSVLIKNIVGLIQPDSGSIKIDGEEVTKYNMEQKFAFMKKCGFLFQSGALFDSLTVLQNIVFYAGKLKNLNAREKEELAEHKLKQVGLKGDILNHYPSELSGGMQKRVALARTIATEPEIIFFDEPTTGLDPVMSNVINELIIKIHKELNATTVVITHDMNCLNRVADKVAMIYQGKILWYGNKDEVKTSDNPYLKQFVNGDMEGPIAL